MLPADFIKPLPLATRFNDNDLSALYWTENGRVFWRHYPLSKADPGSFRSYLGGFAADAKSCYHQNTRLRDADPETFQALSFAYFKDKDHVWTFHGRVKDADASSFVAVDGGAINTYGVLSAFGFGKDRKGVRYIGMYGYEGWLPDVEPETFVSLGDGHFGLDCSTVYAGNKKLPKARPESWAKLAGLYSRDGDRVYYLNRLIRGADAGSFWASDQTELHGNLARDRVHFYENGAVIDGTEFDRHISGANL